MRPLEGKRAKLACRTHVAEEIATNRLLASTAITDQVANRFAEARISRRDYYQYSHHHSPPFLSQLKVTPFQEL